MKTFRIMAIAACLMIAGSAFADVAIQWKSTTYFMLAGGNPATYPGDYLPTNALRLLIWSASAPPTTDYAAAGTGIGAGEYILWSTATDPLRAGDTINDSARFNFSGTAIIKGDADVGGNNINNGYIYSRIFSSSAAVAGQYYYQSQANLGPTITEYDPLIPTSNLEHTTSNVAFLELVDTNAVPPNGMYTVIPEPGSLLLAFPVLGVMAVRRMRKRD